MTSAWPTSKSNLHKALNTTQSLSLSAQDRRTLKNIRLGTRSQTSNTS